MPILDLYAFLKSLARFAVWLGLAIFVVSVLASIITIIDYMTATMVTTKGQIGTAFTSNIPSCLGHMLSILGLDVFVTQVLSGVIGLGMIWAGFVIQLISLQIGMYFRKLLAKSVG